MQSSREGIFSMNIAMSKDLFKERASLNLNVNDVFNSRKRKQTTFVASVFQQYSEFQWRERQISLNFVYRFNQKKKTQRQGRREEGNLTVMNLREDKRRFLDSLSI